MGPGGKAGQPQAFFPCGRCSLRGSGNCRTLPRSEEMHRHLSSSCHGDAWSIISALSSECGRSRSLWGPLSWDLMLEQPPHEVETRASRTPVLAKHQGSMGEQGHTDPCKDRDGGRDHSSSHRRSGRCETESPPPARRSRRLQIMDLFFFFLLVYVSIK